MSLFIPEGFCQIHFVSQAFGGREVTFATAWELLDPTPVSLEGAYDAFVAFGLAIGWPGDVAFRGVRTETGTSDPSAPILGEFTGGEIGSGGAELLPPNNSFLVKKNTALGGRKNRGRAFIPHVQEDEVDGNGNIDSVFVENAQDAFITFNTAVGTALEVTAGVLLHTDPADTPTPLVSGTWSSKIATQRRRYAR